MLRALRLDKAVAAHRLSVIEKMAIVFLKCPTPALAAASRHTVGATWRRGRVQLYPMGSSDRRERLFLPLVEQFGANIQRASGSLY